VIEGDVGFWIAFNVVVTVLLFTVTLVFLVRRARRERRLTPELALYLATLSLGWMEAVIDWGAFVYYAPDWPHFPTSWPIVRLIPILPLHIPLCYTWFFFGGAWIAMRAARATVARWPRVRLGPALIGYGFVVGFLLDFAVESFFITVAKAWTYTQTWGPLTLFAGEENQWPVYMGFAMALTIAPITYLVGRRDDQGRDVIGGVVARATRRRWPRWPLYLLSWIVVVHIVYGTVSLGYAVLRWTGVQTTVSTVRPYDDGPAWYDGDVTRPGDRRLDDEPRALRDRRSRPAPGAASASAGHSIRPDAVGAGATG
jgi:hypothetical protein